MKADFSSMTLAEMEAFIISAGEKKYRAKQIYQWINKRQARGFSEMSDIPAELREKLEEQVFVSQANIKGKLVSADGNTIKYLLELEKDTIIECVLMKYSYGHTVCISTQAGCRMGCAFCVTASSGFDRDLTAGEICAQVYLAGRDSGQRISNVVFMGCGEPFDNYENVMKAIGLLNSKEGLNIGQRSMTVSTVGITDKIYKFAEEGGQVNLAVSLHASNDRIRKTQIPSANKYGIGEIIKACKAYSEKTNRRVTYEYALISGINDSPRYARELSEILRNTLSHVNLIPVNPGRGAVKPPDGVVEEFAGILTGKGIETTIRREMGSDINAACGQLRAGYGKAGASSEG